MTSVGQVTVCEVLVASQCGKQSNNFPFFRYEELFCLCFLFVFLSEL